MQPEIVNPAGMATPNKQISVKNRRMNPPRPARSNRGTVCPSSSRNLRFIAILQSPSSSYCCGPPAQSTRDRAKPNLSLFAPCGYRLPAGQTLDIPHRWERVECQVKRGKDVHRYNRNNWEYAYPCISNAYFCIELTHSSRLRAKQPR